MEALKTRPAQIVMGKKPEYNYRATQLLLQAIGHSTVSSIQEVHTLAGEVYDASGAMDTMHETKGYPVALIGGDLLTFKGNFLVMTLGIGGEPGGGTRYTWHDDIDAAQTYARKWGQRRFRLPI